MREAGTRTARSPIWGGPQVAFILDLAKEMANRLTADRNGKSVQPKWSVMAWANVNGPGDGNICHYHPGAFWSGTYYVADGGCATDPSLGGEFEMLDPRGAGPGMYAPSLEIHGRRRPVGRRRGDHQAAAGTLVPVSLMALSSSPSVPGRRSAHLHRVQSQRLSSREDRRMSAPASRASKRQSRDHHPAAPIRARRSRGSCRSFQRRLANDKTRSQRAQRSGPGGSRSWRRDRRFGRREPRL